MHASHSPSRSPPPWAANTSLAALAPRDAARWAPHLTVSDLPLGHVLVEAHAKVEHVHFPTTAIVSLIHLQSDGSTAEVAVIGREGYVGVPVVTGGEAMPYLALVQTPGEVWRLPAALVADEMARGGPVARRLLLFVQALLTQIALTAVCNRHHSLDQHLCRWLLLMFDRLDPGVLPMTQEMIGAMLGVRRETVTTAARVLQDAGLIRYARGCIELLDRPGLEARVCECHGVVAREYRRLLA